MQILAASSLAERRRSGVEGVITTGLSAVGALVAATALRPVRVGGSV